ncbi:MAG: metal-sensitive transcriptional regulator [Planctomycetota bacterium]|nr:MAG: metal-sensitive transcriptional regulator [Planctomycetota bacterium]
MSTDETTKLVNRVRRVKGQVEAVERMIADEAYCVDVLMQISAAIGALRKIGESVLEHHLRTCVQDALASPEPSEREQKIEELMQVFRRYGK